MYLVHFIVIDLYKKTPLYLKVSMELHFEYGLNYLVIVLCTFSISLLTHKYIEQKGESLGKRLITKLGL
jgi:peptidoglycan/LPS O-acetylase OafA/YrhL